MVHILTHDDLDGYSAGYVVLKHFGEENCDVEHFNYDRDPDLTKFSEGDTIVITDYSLSNELYHKILEIVGETGSLVWCDHHISAITRYQEDPTLDLPGLRSTKFCGAALAWFFYNTSHTAEDLEIMDENVLVEELPYWLKLVDAWDAWKTESVYRESAEYLNMCLANQLSMEKIDEIATDDTALQACIEKGRIYVEYRDSWAEHFCDKYMFTRKLSGWLFNTPRDVDVAVLNIGCASSKYFGDIIDDVDVCITMCFNGEKWVVSFYSNKEDIDCSYAAKVFGGGGHKGAAGCTFNQQQPPISVGNTEIFRKGENIRWQKLKTKTEKN